MRVMTMIITLLYRVTRDFSTQIAGRVGGKFPLTVFAAKSILDSFVSKTVRALRADIHTADRINTTPGLRFLG